MRRQLLAYFRLFTAAATTVILATVLHAAPEAAPRWPDCGSACTAGSDCATQCQYPVGEEWAFSTCGDYDGGASNGWCDGDSCDFDCSVEIAGDTVCYSSGDPTTCEDYGNSATCGDFTCASGAGENSSNCPEDCDGQPVSPDVAPLTLMPGMSVPQSFLDMCQDLQANPNAWSSYLTFVGRFAGFDSGWGTLDTEAFHDCFSAMSSAGLGLQLETAVLQEGADAAESFSINSVVWNDLLSNGAPLTTLAADDVYSLGLELGYSEPEIVQETADWIQAIREDTNFSSFSLTLIHNQPLAGDATDLENFLADLADELDNRSLVGFDTVMIDHDLAGVGSEWTWTQASDMVNVIHNAGLQFDALIWGGGSESFGTDIGYLRNMFQAAHGYADHGIVPDRVTLDSYHEAPHVVGSFVPFSGHGHHPLNYLYAVARLVAWWPW